MRVPRHCLTPVMEQFLIKRARSLPLSHTHGPRHNHALRHRRSDTSPSNAYAHTDAPKKERYKDAKETQNRRKEYKKDA